MSLNTSLSQLTSRMSSRGRAAGPGATEPNTRRMGHGGSAWSLPLAGKILRQPQDGAPRAATIPFAENLLHEPEDATLTGGTRSLTRRLLGLNFSGGAKKTADAVKAHPGGSQIRIAA
jgi:hypothetical protein